jgi:hypothetical protein
MAMKKTFSIALILGLIVGATGLPAEAKKKKAKAREISVRYENPAIGVGGLGGGCLGCPTIATGTGEVFAIIQIVDDASPSGYVSFNYDSDGDGIQNIGSGPIVCGETPEPIAVEPATTYNIWPWAAGIECPGSSSTAGEVKMFVGSSPEAVAKAAGL